MWAMEAGSVCSWTLTAPYGHYVALKRGPVDLHCVSGWQTLAVHDGQDITNSSLIVTVSFLIKLLYAICSDYLQGEYSSLSNIICLGNTLYAGMHAGLHPTAQGQTQKFLKG